MHAPTLRHTLLSATTFLVLSSLTPRDAHADCLGWGDQVLADRYVPNGTPGIRLVLALAANVENISEGYVQLERRSAQGDFDSVPHDISADAEEDEHYFWVRESGGMVDDATYRVTITNPREPIAPGDLNLHGQPSQVEVTLASAPAPQSQIQVTTGELINSCEITSRELPWESCPDVQPSQYIAAQRIITFELPPTLQQWQRTIDLSAQVDGKEYREALHYYCYDYERPDWFLRDNQFVLAADCGVNNTAYEDDFLSQGDHTLVLRATLPGTDISWESDPVTFSLACPSDEPDSGDEPVTSEDEPLAGGGDTPSDQMESDEDDSCSHTPGRAPRAPWELLLIATAVILGRRRQRQNV